ncbi:lysophospholipid acyltransferase family protein [Roseibium polysiphoniae]|uniref:1-acyl-sn-glycerol-3-phosphate acyltransferase n=1 Tax=Roseibium polysiphoniae TaxID=2571221 RepID=A0ABR9CHK6_9HYPH|nr:lysophospholipid acyltransferase family protein [Roseibium polysiphoniae]MBD8878632.1 1-acyl-sn-glycerol-3-phosphate acyltransferase [Roseibium polysiphoniae]
MARIKAIWAIFALTVVSVALIPPQWLAVRLGHPLQRKLPHLWHRVATRLVGIRVQQVGAPERSRPLLVTANHASWVDITVVGSLMPLSFIAKSEVAGWPIFGLFAKLQRTVFVNRTRRTDTGKVADAIAERMAQGDAMVLFAEGTSNDGNGVLPFRSALLGAATRALDEDGEVWVQPLSVAYHSLHGLPMGRQFRPHVAWYGDMELAGHLWGVFTEGALDVVVTWGEPVLVTSTTDRKALTRQLEEQVRAMTVASLRRGAVDLLKTSDISDSALFSSDPKPAKAGG